MISSIGILGVVIIFGAIIFVHELGHFLLARWTGTGVLEFSLGFGPPLLQKQVGDTLYALRIIPLGGYCRISGMAEDDDREDPPDSFERKPWLARFAIIVAGCIMNMVLAFVLIVVVGMAIGYPVPQPGGKVIIDGVMEFSPADKAGIQPGDQVVAVAGVRPITFDSMKSLIQKAPASVTVVVLRNGVEQPLKVTPEDTPKADEDGWWFYKITPFRGIGVSLEETTGEFQRLSFIDSIEQGAYVVVDKLHAGVRTILSLATGRIDWKYLSGPVGIMSATYKGSKGATDSRMGVLNIFSMAATFSVLIGFFNLLPIPALDGGRLLFLVIEKVRGRPVDKQKEALVHMIGMAVLLSLIALISIKDVWSLISNR